MNVMGKFQTPAREKWGGEGRAEGYRSLAPDNSFRLLGEPWGVCRGVPSSRTHTWQGTAR